MGLQKCSDSRRKADRGSDRGGGQARLRGGGRGGGRVSSMAWPLGETATVYIVPSVCQVWWQLQQVLSLGHLFLQGAYPVLWMRRQAQRGRDCPGVKLQSQCSNPGPWDFIAQVTLEGHVSQDWVDLPQRLEPPQELWLQVQGARRCPGCCVFPPGGHRQFSCPVMSSCPHPPLL